MSTIKALLFDLDGTLANTLPLCIKVYQQTLEHYSGRAYSEEEITAHFGLSEEGIFRRLLPQHWEEALDYYHANYKHLHNECNQTFPGIVNALDALKDRNVNMAIITGKGIVTALYTLDYLGIAHYFRMVEAGSTSAIVKAQAIHTILTSWNIEPQQAAYIGDSDTDITEAVKAGVLPLGAAWATTETLHRLNDVQPAKTFASVESFIKWIHESLPLVNT